MMGRGPVLHEYLHSPDQYLNPEAIYTLSWVLGEILDAEGVDSKLCWIVPNLFDKKTRSWHSACVFKGCFNPENSAFVDGAATLLKRIAPKGNLKSAFERAKSNLLKGWSYEKAKRTLEDASESDKIALHRALLLLYHGFKIHRAQTLPGILYRGCYKHNHNGDTVVEYFDGTPDSAKSAALSYFGSYKNYNHDDLGDQELFDQLDCKLAYEHISSTAFNDRGGKLVVELVNLFYFDYLLSEGFDPKQAPVIVLPIYDAWLGGWGYGGLWGCLILTFKNDEAKRDFLKKHFDNLRVESEWLASWLEVSAMAVLSGQPIEPPYDLVEHFLRMVIHMQDWERVAVFRRNQNDGTPLYCYQREKREPDEDANWERCNPDEEKCGKCRQDNWKPKRVLKWNRDGKWTIWGRDIMPELTQEEINAWEDIVYEFEYPQSACIPTDIITRELFEFALIDQQIRVLRTLIPKVQARRAALRNSAVSIMGRNMSHNIGSHVLARLQIRKDLRRPEKITDPTTLSGKLIRYLQERMDFLAEASTTKPFFALPLNLFSDVVQPFCEQELILGSISGFGGLQAVVKAWVNGKAVAIKPEMQPETQRDLKKADVCFDATGGRAGMHALYVVIENIIRNSAKHGSGGETWSLGCPPERAGFSVTYTLSIPKYPNPNPVLCLDGDGCFNADFIKSLSIVTMGPLPLESTETVRPGTTILRLPSVAEAISCSVDSPVKARIRVTFGKKLRKIPLLPLSLNGQSPGTVEVRIRITEGKKPGFYEVLVWDLQRNGAPTSSEEEALDKKINDIIEKPLIEQDGTINQSAWGIREMQIACAYLRSLALEDLEARGNHDVLQACLVNDAGEEGREDSLNLAYRFYFPKTQHLLVVSPSRRCKQRTAASSRADVACMTRADLSKSQRLTQQYCLWLPMAEPTPKEMPLLPVRVLFSNEARDVVSVLRNEDGGSDLAAVLAKAWLARVRKTKGITNGVKIRTVYTGYTGSKTEVAENLELSVIEGRAIRGDGTLLVFDDHGYILDPNGSPPSIPHCKSWMGMSPDERLKKLANLAFYEPLRTSYPQRILLQESDPVKVVAYKALLEAAALTRVLILDERIQLAAHTTWDTSCYLLKDVLRLARVFVPPKESCDLDKETLNAAQILAWIERDFNKDAPLNIFAKKFDFIVIHQGVVEKLRKAGDRKDRWLSAMAKLCGCAGRLIVCSGRGAPRGLPDGARFLPLSGLLHAVTLRPSKFHLVHLLCASRSPQPS